MDAQVSLVSLVTRGENMAAIDSSAIVMRTFLILVAFHLHLCFYTMYI